jgi:hypothetical protein
MVIKITKANRLITNSQTPQDTNHVVVVIYCHFQKKIGVGQTPRLCNLPSKSYSSINVPCTSGDDLKQSMCALAPQKCVAVHGRVRKRCCLIAMLFM